MQSAGPASSLAPASPGSGRRRLILTLVVLTVAVSALVRFAGLDTLPGHVFDEYYYAHDAAALLHGDLGPRGAESWRPGVARSLAHPELATLAIAGSIAAFGDGPWGWRLPAALAGTLLIALVYPLARRMRLPPIWALAATVLAAADTMLVVESRLAVLDAFVALGTAACIYCALRAAAPGDHFARWTVLCGLAAGVAVGSKWSGALAVLAAFVVYGLAARRLGGRRLALAVGGVLAIAAVVYVAGYAGYFWSGHSAGDWLHLQRYMLGFNWDVRGTVVFASRPATWPADVHPIWYRYAATDRGTMGLIAIGNPLLWWAALVAFVVLGVQAALRRDARLGLAPLLVAALYVPWLFTTRQAYIYYMVPVVPFLAILVATALARVARQRAACPPQALGFAAGALLTAGALSVAGLGEGVIGDGSGLWWRGAALVAGACFAAAAVAAIVRAPQRRPVTLAAAAWAYVGAVAGLGLAWLPFLLGYPVLFEVYRRLTWFVTWK
jgi:dolichyl-phosphate-mannose--protein O-mannosyl transferase